MTAEAREKQARITAKFASTLVIAAVINVVARLAWEDGALLHRDSFSSVGHSVSPARTILNQVLRRYPGG